MHLFICTGVFLHQHKVLEAWQRAPCHLSEYRCAERVVTPVPVSSLNETWWPVTVKLYSCLQPVSVCHTIGCYFWWLPCWESALGLFWHCVISYGSLPVCLLSFPPEETCTGSVVHELLWTDSPCFWICPFCSSHDAKFEMFFKCFFYFIIHFLLFIRQQQHAWYAICLIAHCTI